MPGGYRAPQAFDEDMHIAIVGGKRVRIRLADDLKEERSHSVSLSADLYHNFRPGADQPARRGILHPILDDVFALRDHARTRPTAAKSRSVTTVRAPR